MNRATLWVAGIVFSTVAFGFSGGRAADAPLPEGGAPALGDDPVASLRYVGGMRQFASRPLFAVEGQPFEKAVRLESAEQAKNFWDVSVEAAIARPIAKDSAVLATFFARGVGEAPVSKEARLMVYFQQAEMSSRKPLRQWVAVGPEWKRYTLPFRALDAYEAGKGALSFGIQDGPLAIEIGGIGLLDYGSAKSVGDLPSSVGAAAGTMGGDPFLAPWEKMTKDFIGRHRVEYPNLGEICLETLRPEHPRLMLTKERFQWLKERIADGGDKDLAALHKRLYEIAEICLKHDPLDSEKAIVKRNNPLQLARRCMQHAYALGLAWRLTGDPRYFDRLLSDLVVVCGFSDWSPKFSFLVTSEMCHAVGVAYDWLYPALSESDRAMIRTALKEKGLDEGLKAYAGGGWWPQCDHNWNPVCNFGLIIGSLAIAETDPDYARKIIPAAAESLPIAMVRYAPDGAWTEGPGYWGYATSYAIYGMAALESALGRDFGLSDFPGFDKTGTFRIYGAGPTLLTLNFADCGMNSQRKASWQLFWLARRYGNSLYARWEHNQLGRFPGEEEHLVFYEPRPDGDMPSLELDRKFDGPVGVAVLRSSWEDPNALFIGVKAGYVQVNHGAMDLGNFEMDALGVRWSRDLGAENYDLPGYFDRSGPRWQYYRCQSRSHSVPLIDGQDQFFRGTSTITNFQSSGDSGGFAVVDLSNAYPDRAKRVTRGVRMLAGRRSLLVQDEFVLDKPRALTWAMTTGAEIAIGSAGEAVLTQDGKQLRAVVLSPAGAVFGSESCEREAPLAPNKGYRRLLVQASAEAGEATVAVWLAPVWADGAPSVAPGIAPISKW